MRINAGTVLLYNCSGPEFSKMRQIFAMLRLRMRPVAPDRYRLPLKDLAAGKGEAGAMEEPFPERVLVFCNLNDALLNQVLEVVRVAGLPDIDFKAVMTETNREWDSYRLLEHLREEREAIRAAKERKAAEEQAAREEQEDAPEQGTAREEAQDQADAPAPDSGEPEEPADS